MVIASSIAIFPFMIVTLDDQQMGVVPREKLSGYLCKREAQKRKSVGYPFGVESEPTYAKRG